MKNDKYIIRTDRAGVFYAGIESRNGQEAVLTDARRIHYWQGATECIGIALHGLGSGSKVTEAAPKLTVLGVIEEIPCTDKARKCLDKHPAWKA